jgi:hypothetical protein
MNKGIGNIRKQGFVSKFISYTLIFLYFSFKLASFINFSDKRINRFFDNPLIHIIFLVYIAIRLLLLIKRISSSYQNQFNSLDFYDRITLSLQTAFPNFNEKFWSGIAQEISVVYYALFGFKKSKNEQKIGFTYHQNNSAVSLYWVFIFLTLIETGIVHLLLFNYNLQVISFVLLIINVYSILFFVGHINAMKKRFILLEDQGIKLNNGLFISEFIDYSNIAEIGRFNEKLLQDKSVLKIGLIGKLEPHNVFIKLHKETEIKIIYGIVKTVNSIAMYIDEVSKFETQINEKITELNT